MKIIEVRDGFIKFEADDSIYLSSFIKVDGDDKSYIAQVIQQKNNISFAKILFVLSDGKLFNYDKTEPSIDAMVSEYTQVMLDSFAKEGQSIIVGKTLDDKNNIIFDISAFNKKTMISLDDRKNNNIVVQNLVKQFSNAGKRTIVIDTLGVVNAEKYVAGQDFKIPLDKNSLKFIYNDCLNDATAESKSTIVDIFKDLAEYSETVQFVPFSALKTIIDDMVEKSHVFKLLVLKNKLAKFDKLNYFASNEKEVDKINKILSSNTAVIDLSGLDASFINRYLSFIYEKLKGNDDVQIVLELSNSISKQSLKKTLVSELPTAFITHSNFNYLSDIKNFFDNFIIVPSIANNQIFKLYSIFLKAINKEYFLVTGEATNYIPLVSKIKLVNDFIQAHNPVIEDTPEEIVVAENVNEVEELSDDNFQENLSEILEEKNETVEYTNDEDEQDTDPIIKAINEKSNAAISEITENVEVPEEIEMFTEEESENSSDYDLAEELENITEEEHVQENIENVESEDSAIDNIEQEFQEEPSDKEIDTQEIVYEDDIQELENIEEVAQDNFEISDLDDVNTINDETISDDKDANAEPEVLEENADGLQPNEDMDVEQVSAYEPSEEDVKQESDSYSQEYEYSTSVEPTDNITEELPNEEVVDVSDIDINLDDNIELEQDVSEGIVLTPIEEFDAEQPEIPVEESSIEESSIEEGDSLNNDNIDFEEIVELDPSESDENDIIVDLEEDFADSVDSDKEEQIVQDVDKVFTTRKEDDDISDSDLDFIDELNSDEDITLEDVSNDEAILNELAGEGEDNILETEQEEYSEEIKDYEPEILEHRESDATIVPVYDADIPQEDIVVSDPIQQGDSVFHAKYGAGVVEKMIKYGSKTLFSINFENIGRRLLDPTLTEIKKQ